MFGDLLNAASNALKPQTTSAPNMMPLPSLTGGAGGAAGPSSAEGASYGSGADNSGWNVNFSGVQSASSQQDKSSGAGLLSGVGGAIPWWAWAALGLAVLWRMRRSAK